MPLGDSFPEELREQLSDNNLKVGSVLRFFIKDTNPPKDKRAIVVGFNNDKILFAYVLINSEINPNMFPTSRLRDLHLPFEANGRSYLTHDSFVDCSQIKEEDAQTMRAAMTDNVGIHIGDLSETDCKKVIETLKTSFRIDPKIKKKYGIV